MFRCSHTTSVTGGASVGSYGPHDWYAVELEVSTVTVTPLHMEQQEFSDGSVEAIG